MNKDIFKYLQTYSYNPFEVNRLIVSSFLYSYDLQNTKNKLLAPYLIQKGDKDYEELNEFLAICKFQGFEDLIKIFEFVVSPKDKKVSGAVYTPQNIRNYIVEQCFSQIDDFSKLKVCDPACGCAGFLYTAAQTLHRKTGRTYHQIFSQNIYGLDVQEYAVTRSKILLTLLALYEGELIEDLEFNVFLGNALAFEWDKKVKEYQGFDVIIGNPPYVCSRNMDKQSLLLLDKWSVTKSGHPDLYIPFFQIGYENLKEKGILGLITVNTFIKSVNGRALREYFSTHKINLKIINFGGEQVFKDKNTYTCLCFINGKGGTVSYKRLNSIDLNQLRPSSFYHFKYEDLNNHDGWNLTDAIDKNLFIKKVEAIGQPFKDLYVTRNGIATLKNDIYKFTPKDEDDTYFYHVTSEGKEFAIEKAICRKIINANKIKTEQDLKSRIEWIIFPYSREKKEIIILDEKEFISEFPYAYKYLKAHKAELSTRDKGAREYEKWYAYGRRQSMDIHAYKLFFPHICERPTFVISKDKDLLFYNGIAVISNDLDKLRTLKILLESDLFFEYIKNTTKDYSSGYISMSKNYIKNFGIVQLTPKDQERLIAANGNANAIIRKMYELDSIK